MNIAQVRLIHQIMTSADTCGIPLWISGGWAIDARLGEITRDHDDIDLTFPADRQADFEAMLADLGGQVTERTDYGFLARLRGVLLDCEPARWSGTAYEIDDAPEGSCPANAEGILEGIPVRCNSWEAILWDYFYYLDEVPRIQWPGKHVQSYAMVVAALGDDRVRSLRAVFDSRHPG
ncbi:nucleotidyltransferase domain-containing protein [Noviherbaspirillum aridicola]|uniref:Aminoglycoside-2''-adenylyltransferase n=1 Tax=Noviherbaspirillum aridicola TaxID=2849687 RepID=A0ABQ4QBF2_9BURK|nr:aminoglycoside nucleotidyltransferase ANT(2'')-Ia [Noviherbaspirillum aridicola]GIZ54140.1 hypothetical protein NCCP691_41540 [Noviherbaspirillum aridicola]